MKMRDTILLYTSMKEPVDALDDEQAGKLLKAILAYQCGETVKLDGLLNVVFLQIRQQIDRNNEKYEEATRKRSEAGKKGMASRWGSNNNDNNVITNDNNVINVIASNNKNNLYVNDNVNGNVNGNDNVSVLKDRKKKMFSNENTKEVVDMWNASFANTDVPKVTIVKAGSKREKMLNARIDEFGIEKIKDAIALASASKFLTASSWFSFDWFICPNNFVKVAEGNYQDHAAPASTSNKTADNLQEFYNRAVAWASEGE